MLEIKNINKSYRVGDFEQKVLKDVSIKFRKSEFVAILGHSGSGKTTLLNLIGGLDRYDSGDIVINGKSTKNFKDKDKIKIEEIQDLIENNLKKYVNLFAIFLIFVYNKNINESEWGKAIILVDRWRF